MCRAGEVLFRDRFRLLLRAVVLNSYFVLIKYQQSQTSLHMNLTSPAQSKIHLHANLTSPAQSKIPFHMNLTSPSTIKNPLLYEPHQPVHTNFLPYVPHQPVLLGYGFIANRNVKFSSSLLYLSISSGPQLFEPISRIA